MNLPLSCTCFFGLAIALWIPASLVLAENWPNWRGPRQDGTAVSVEAPRAWDSSQGAAWSVATPGKGSSTPVVWERKIVVTSADSERNFASCYDLDTGKELWTLQLGTAREGKHRKATGANSSPVTDGKTIFVYFKSGDLAALDWDGNVLWHKNLQTEYGPDTLWWDMGTSPVLTKDHVVVVNQQTPPSPSWVAAFDPKTGAEVWKVDRDVPAPEESAQSYTTPLVATIDGEEQILVLGADHVTAHSARDGTEIWRAGGLNPEGNARSRSICSPVISENILLAPYVRGSTLTAIRLGGQGDVTNSHVLWKQTFDKDTEFDVPTPTTRDGLVYICSDRGTVQCLDLKTGDVVWSKLVQKHRTAYSSSPILAGEYLYVMREDTSGFVVNVKTQAVSGPYVLDADSFAAATPVLIGKKLLLRTREKLYCFE